MSVLRGGWDALVAGDRGAGPGKAVRLARRYHEAMFQAYPGFMASRSNYDVAQGRDAAGAGRSGVLEQSWRIGGASGAEIAALGAARTPTRPSTGAGIDASSVTAPQPPCPAGADVYFAASTDHAGAHHQVHRRANDHADARRGDRDPGRPDELAGTLVAPGTLMPGVLFVHGWGGSQQQYLARAREIAALGCVCLTFDLRGHARHAQQRETVLAREQPARRARRVRRAGRAPGRRPVAIAVVGSSYGGYLAAILTTLRPVRWLALRVPALYNDDGWELPKKQLHKDTTCSATAGGAIAAAENRALRACARVPRRRADRRIGARRHRAASGRSQSYREACVALRVVDVRK